jgi:hypothetical protein
MKSKTTKLIAIAAVISTFIAGSIHLGLKEEEKKVKSRLDISYIVYQQAARECRSNPGACSDAERLGREFDQDLDDVKEATQQASFFLRLTIAVPVVYFSLLLLRLGLTRMFRSRHLEAPHT